MNPFENRRIVQIAVIPGGGVVAPINIDGSILGIVKIEDRSIEFENSLTSVYHCYDKDGKIIKVIENCPVDILYGNTEPDVNEIWNLPEDLLAMNLTINKMAELISEYQYNESQREDLNTRKIPVNEIIDNVMDKARDELEKQKS